MFFCFNDHTGTREAGEMVKIESAAYDGPPIRERRLRTFDLLCIAPYEHEGLVAFLQAEKLKELTRLEIKLFLLLLETAGNEGLTVSFIADWLELPRGSVRSGLNELLKGGYVDHSPFIQHDTRGQKVTGWVCDRSSPWADDDQLFWEFDLL